ncbi:MAG: hypothetical protein ABI679_15545 [Gemmatimonadota bacterium]
MSPRSVQLVRFVVIVLNLSLVEAGCSSSKAAGINSNGNVYLSCTNNCTDLQFDNNLHAANVFVTIKTGSSVAKDFGPLPTDGMVFLVSTDIGNGQVFTISSGTGTGSGALRGATAICTVGPNMLPSADGFGEVLVTVDPATPTYDTFCVTGLGGNWQ